MKKSGLFSCILFIVFTACQKDALEETLPTGISVSEILANYEPKSENVTASVTGFVVDENDAPVSDASIKLGNHTLTTDEYGHFFLDNITMNSRGTIVTVEKDGFFDGSRRFFPEADAQNHLTIQLLEKSFDHSFSSDAGGMIMLSSGASINFEANSIQTMNGSAFTGTVQVAAKWLDPSSVTTLDQMPGNLQGINAKSQEVTLATFGMMAVELQDENGASLNIADNMTARLTMPVPENMQTNAPTEIPLWSYYQEYGMWVEESVATLQNGSYVGEVSHFSFWNCDYPFPLIEFSLYIADEAAMGISNILATIEAVDLEAVTGLGYTDENGILTGLIPANELLVLKVLNICGDVLYSNEIGPFSQNIDLGTISIFDKGENMTTISGTIQCNGQPTSEGIVIVTFDDQRIHHYTNGDSFSFSFTTCEGTTSVNVITIDLDNRSQSPEFTVNAGMSSDLGVIQSCASAVESFLRLNISGEEAFYDEVIYNNGITWTSIEVELGNTTGYIHIGFYGKEPGDYSGDGQNSINQIVDVPRGWFFDNQTPMDVFEVTEYGAIGQPVKGHFSGMIDGQPIEGEFSMIRE